MNSLEFLDDLIRELYCRRKFAPLFSVMLLFRGFHVTLKTFDQEIKSDKLTNFDADKLTWTLLQLAQSLDFLGIEETWNYLQSYVFTSFLSKAQIQQAKQLETSLYKYFIVCAISQRKHQKVVDFLQYRSESLLQEEWLPWSTIVYIKKPETHPPFHFFFSKLWLDTFHTSLKNFLSLALHSMPLPKLLKFNVERVEKKNLELEISKLKETIEDWKLTESLRSSTSSLSLFHPTRGASNDDLEDEKKDDPNSDVLLTIKDIQFYPDSIPMTCFAISLDTQSLIFVHSNEPCTLKSVRLSTFMSITDAVPMLTLHDAILATEWTEQDHVIAITSSSISFIAHPHPVSSSLQHTSLSFHTFLSSSSSSSQCFRCFTLLQTQKTIVLAYSTSTVTFLQYHLPYSHHSFSFSVEEPVQLLTHTEKDRFLIVCFQTLALIYETSTRTLLHTLSFSSLPYSFASMFSFAFCPTDFHVTFVSSHGDAVTVTCVEGLPDLLQSYTFQSWLTPLTLVSMRCFVHRPPYLLLRTGAIYQVGTGKCVPFPCHGQNGGLSHASASVSESDAGTVWREQPWYLSTSALSITKTFGRWGWMDWKEKTLAVGIGSGGMYIVVFH